MAYLHTLGILLRRIEYGDSDLVITFLTRDQGKITLIAKAAKKSRKRFAGVLELFSIVALVWSDRGKGLSLLKEAQLINPLVMIRADIRKTAYASFWVELIYLWTEEGGLSQEILYDLLVHILGQLDKGQKPSSDLSLLFLIRFLTIVGLCPNLNQCVICGQKCELYGGTTFCFDVKKGGIVCHRCMTSFADKPRLSNGTLKLLQWMCSGGLEKAGRVRFSKQAQHEGLLFLEAFVPFHLGKEPKSLKVLRQLRGFQEADSPFRQDQRG